MFFFILSCFCLLKNVMNKPHSLNNAKWRELFTAAGLNCIFVQCKMLAVEFGLAQTFSVAGKEQLRNQCCQTACYVENISTIALCF